MTALWQLVWSGIKKSTRLAMLPLTFYFDGKFQEQSELLKQLAQQQLAAAEKQSQLVDRIQELTAHFENDDGKLAAGLKQIDEVNHFVRLWKKELDEMKAIVRESNDCTQDINHFLKQRLEEWLIRSEAVTELILNAYTYCGEAEPKRQNEG